MSMKNLLSPLSRVEIDFVLKSVKKGLKEIKDPILKGKRVFTIKKMEYYLEKYYSK